MTFTYATGEHDVLLEVRDCDGYRWSSVFAVSVAALNDPVVSPPTAPIDSSPIVAPTDQVDAAAAEAAAKAAAAAKATAASKAAAGASLPNTAISLPLSSGSWPWLTLIGLVGLFGAGAIAEARRRHRARSGASAAT
jgi:hypothetical protein